MRQPLDDRHVGLAAALAHRLQAVAAAACARARSAASSSAARRSRRAGGRARSRRRSRSPSLEVRAGLLLPGEHDRRERLVDLDQVDLVASSCRPSSSACARRRDRRRQHADRIVAAHRGGGCARAASARASFTARSDATSMRRGAVARSGSTTAAVRRPPSRQRLRASPSSRAWCRGAGPRRSRRSPSGTISRSKRPSSIARIARWWLSSANALHVLARDVPLLGDHLGAAELRDLLRAVARDPALGARERIREAERLARSVIADEIGIRLMFCTPPATTRSLVPLITACAAKCTACCDEPHWRSIVDARHVLGQARREPAGARDVAGLRADRVDAAEDHVLDGAGIDARARRSAP